MGVSECKPSWAQNKAHLLAIDAGRPSEIISVFHLLALQIILNGNECVSIVAAIIIFSIFTDRCTRSTEIRRSPSIIELNTIIASFAVKLRNGFAVVSASFNVVSHAHYNFCRDVFVS